VRVVVQLLARGLLAAKVQGQDALAVGQRTHGAQVGGARQAHARDPGVRRLVDHDAGQQFRRILVELDGAVVARAGLLAAVQQRGGEVGGQTTDRDHLGAAVDALGGETRKAGDRLGDRDVRQLADVLGRDAFQDLLGIALFGDGVGDGGAEAGDDDLFDLVAGLGGGRLGLAGGGDGLFGGLSRKDCAGRGGDHQGDTQGPHAGGRTKIGNKGVSAIGAGVRATRKLCISDANIVHFDPPQGHRLQTFSRSINGRFS
jgi:hypothetical protein